MLGVIPSSSKGGEDEQHEATNATGGSQVSQFLINFIQMQQTSIHILSFFNGSLMV